MSQPIPWEEWEAEARRLHRALQGQPASASTLSAAKNLLARLLGHAHWHEVEEQLKKRDGAMPIEEGTPCAQGERPSFS